MYFKITNINENNDGYQYVDGLNVCSSGQEYFWIVDEKHVFGYIGQGYYLRDVTIPVYDPDFSMTQHFSKTKWLVNKIYLGRKYLLSDIKTIQYLLDAGANPQVNDNYAICWASDNGYTDIVRLLIDHNVNIFASNNRALCWASESGHLAIVQILIDNGANVQILQNEPLRSASMSGHYEVVKLLLEKGADPNAVDNEAILLAKKNGHDTIVDLLIKYQTGK